MGIKNRIKKYIAKEEILAIKRLESKLREESNRANRLESKLKELSNKNSRPKNNNELENILSRIPLNSKKLYRTGDNEVYYHKFGPITLEIIQPFHNNYSSLFSLIDFFPDSFTIEKGGNILFNNQGMNLHVNDCHTIYAIKELLVWRIYNFHKTNPLPYVVIDIGMNIGLSSLIFANRKDVKYVFGFEPFESTYKMAKNNIRLNPNISHRIILHNYGLEDKEATLRVPFNEEEHLINSTSDFFIKNFEASITDYVEVNIKKSSQIIHEIVETNKGFPIVIKLDCEGAEYRIMNDLDASGELINVDVILMEWHYNGIEPLKNILIKNDFFIIATVNPENSNVGMIYAYRSKK